MTRSLQSVAFLGMGLMGSRMARRLLDAQFNVAVWNRTTSACAPLERANAELLNLTNIANFDVIALCLADDIAVQAVVEQILPYLAAGQVIVDFSSLSLDMTQNLANLVASKNVTWIDAPVSGGVQGAENGSLVIFAGGDTNTIARLSPFFAPLAQKVTHMGQTGTGQVTKICNQLIVAATAQLISEAVSLAERAGVNAHQLAPALQGGFADSKPMQILAPRMANRVFEPVQWKTLTLTKDLTNAIHLATSTGMLLPMTQFALQRYQQHMSAGFAEADLASLISQHVSNSSL